MTISRRPEVPDDDLFLRRLVIETIARELLAEAWPEPMRSRLLDIQYTSRRQSILAAFPCAKSEIILVGGENAGWLVVADLRDEIRLVEIWVLNTQRGRGVGSSVIRDILTQGVVSGKPVRLSVHIENAGAIRLYERLGFRRTESDAVRQQMEFVSLDDRAIGIP